MSSIGRNAPCPCGSGKKYKRCCANKIGQSQSKASMPGHTSAHNSHRKALSLLDLAQSPLEYLEHFVPNIKLNQHKEEFIKLVNTMTFDLIRFEQGLVFHPQINQSRWRRFPAIKIETKSLLLGMIQDIPQDEDDSSFAPDISQNDIHFTLVSLWCLIHIDTMFQWSQSPVGPSEKNHSQLLKIRHLLLSCFPQILPKEKRLRVEAITLHSNGQETVLNPSDDRSKMNKSLAMINMYNTWKNNKKAQAFSHYIKYDALPAQKDFLNSITIHFSDQYVINCAQLDTDPYSLLVPQELFPKDFLFSYEDDPYVSNYTSLTKVKQDTSSLYRYRSFSNNYVTSYYFSFIKNLSHYLDTLKEKNNQNSDDHFNVILSCERSNRNDTSILSINSIEFIKMEDLHIQFGPDSLTIDIRSTQKDHDQQELKQSKTILPYHHLYLQDEKKLIFTPINKIATPIESEFTEYKIIKSNNLLCHYSWKEITCPRSCSETFEFLVQKVNPFLKKASLSFSPLICHTSKEIRLYYNLHKIDKNLFEVYFKLNQLNQSEESSFYLSALDHQIVPYVKGLVDGLGGCFTGANSEIAVKTKGVNRQNELKLLRHKGWYMALLTEAIKLKRQLHHGPSPSQEKPLNKSQISALRNDIFEKLGSLAQNILDRKNEIEELKGKLLSKLVSTRFIKLINNWIDDFLECDFSNTTYYYNQTYLKPDLNLCYLDLLEFLSYLQLQSFGNQKFTRSKSPTDLKITSGHLTKSVSNQPLSIFFSYQHSLMSDRIIDQMFEDEELFGNYKESENDDFHDSDDTNQINSLPPDSSPLCFYVGNASNEILNATIMNASIGIEGRPIEEMTAHDIKAQLSFNEEGMDKDLGQGLDWFELKPQVFFKGKPISLEQLASFKKENILEHNGVFYKLSKKEIPTIEWLNYFWENLSNPNRIKSPKSSNTFHSLPRSQTLEMLALRKAGIPVIGGDKWKKICDDFDNITNRSASETPDFGPDCPVPLKNFQRHGSQWFLDLYKIGLGGILADDMGLGKTIQTIAVFNHLYALNQLGHCLIVVPSALIYNWQNEVQKFSPNLPIQIFESQRKDFFKNKWEHDPYSLTIITYGLMNEHENLLMEKEWNLIIFDEAQNLKNIQAKRTTMARKLKAQSKFVLTGTPMENHYGEYYSLIDLVTPGALGEYNVFMNRYNLGTFQGGLKRLKTKDIEFLKLKTAPLVMRRIKDLILNELPEKVETLIPLDFEKQQKKIYKDVALSWNEKVMSTISNKGVNRTQIEMLTALLRLRQVCSCPQAIANVTYQLKTPKLERLLDMVEEIISEGKSILIFTNFVTTLNYLKEHFDQKGFPSLTMTGKNTSNQKKEILHQFEVTTTPIILLMTLKTGGVGLNLTKASYVFHIDPWWNPAVENQATDRVYRMGQNQSVQVYRFIMKDSVEEKIETLKGHKAIAFNALFEENEEDMKKQITFGKQGMTVEDFSYLLDL